MVKTAVKSLAHWSCVLVLLPLAALTGFGRVVPVFVLFAQICALLPGIIGDYLRVAYYVLTLRECSRHCRISFGTFFAQSRAAVEEGAYIGAYCVIGACRIGSRTQIASHVQILSGRHQHPRDSTGRIGDIQSDVLREIHIGADCWIGAAAVVAADVGAFSTIGAGSVVVHDIPACVVAVGTPARVVRQVPVEGSS